MHLIEPAPSWFDPDETIWLDRPSQSRKAAYRQKVAAGAAHLLRQVHFSGPGPEGMYVDTIQGVWDIIDLAEREFDVIRGLEVQVPDTEWYVRRSPRHIDDLQLIAKVAVIEGLRVVDLPKHGLNDQYVDCALRLQPYRYRNTPRIPDVSAIQCMLGYPRDAAMDMPPDDFFMVDIEPVLV